MVESHGGRVPERLEDLLALPGVGPYTARAVRAFATSFRRRWSTPISVGSWLAGTASGSHRTECNNAADALAPDDQPWQWNQSLMELGAWCTKRSPSCGACPVHTWCRWRGQGDDPAVGSAAVSTPQARFEGVIVNSGPTRRCVASRSCGAIHRRQLHCRADQDRRTDCRRARARRAGRRGRDAPAAVSVGLRAGELRDQGLDRGIRDLAHLVVGAVLDRVWREDPVGCPSAVAWVSAASMKPSEATKTPGIPRRSRSLMSCTLRRAAPQSASASITASHDVAIS